MSNPVFAVAPDRQYLPEPQRLVEMALEVGVIGDAVERAADASVFVEFLGLPDVHNDLVPDHQMRLDLGKRQAAEPGPGRVGSGV